VTARHVLLCYITDRRQFPGNESVRRERLLAKIDEAARAGIDYIQLREKDLPARDLEWLAAEAVKRVRRVSGNCESRPDICLLVNSRADVAFAVGADGVHLPSNDLSPIEVLGAWESSAASRSQPKPLVGVSCHSVAEVERARDQRADYALLAPIFEKRDAPRAKALGLKMLRQACRFEIPVLALGGVTLTNAADCIAAGAAGIAAIRLFQEKNIADVVQRLRK
jgi:thiamine-phosphate pyrophosphorylase